MRIAPSLILYSALTASVCHSVGPPQPTLRITLESYKSPRPDVYVLGEGVRLLATLENNGAAAVTFAGVPFGAYPWPHSAWRLRITGDAVGEVCYRYAAMAGESITTQLGPGESISENVNSPWKLGPGTYEAWVEYDPPADLGWFGDEESILGTRLESNHLCFQIVRPSGLDARVLEKYESEDVSIVAQSGVHSWCNSLVEPFGTAIVEDFPTSSFAGWALAGRPTVQDSERIVGLLRQNAAPPPQHSDASVERRVAEAQAGLNTFAQEQLEQMATYLQNRPDFVDADWMNFKIAYLCLELGDIGRARTILDQLVSEEDLPVLLRDQVDALRAFAKERASEE